MVLTPSGVTVKSWKVGKHTPGHILAHQVLKVYRKLF